MNRCLRMFALSLLQAGLCIALIAFIHVPRALADDTCQDTCDSDYGNCGEICSGIPGAPGASCYNQCSTNYSNCFDTCTGGSGGGPQPDHTCLRNCGWQYNNCVSKGGGYLDCAAGDVSCCNEAYAECAEGCVGE